MLAKTFIRFAAVGGLGTVTNLVLFFIMADKGGINATVAGVACFVIAGTQNYVFNHLWTFTDLTKSTLPTFKKWGLFLSSSLLGLGINLSVLNAILCFWELPYKTIAQGVGILSGMAVNYCISKRVVFKLGYPRKKSAAMEKRP